MPAGDARHMGRGPMRILFLTFYYPPDLSAGSFRANPLVMELLRQGAGKIHVDVVTTMPNRYQSHVQSAPEFEEQVGLTIRRIALPRHQSGMLDQTRAFLTFALAVRRNIKGKKWDLIFATSSRLMTAALGAEIARATSTPVYLDVRDLFTDTVGDLLARSPLRILMPFIRQIERRTFDAATRINVVSPGFVTHVHTLAPRHRCRVFTNGIDEDFLSTDFSQSGGKTGRRLIVYAGNMGESQGLHRILPDAAKQLADVARFRIIGDGGRRRELEAALSYAGCDNVEILNPVPRAQLLGHYREADCFFTHLNNQPAFAKVIPSKLFEYGATGKPVVAGVGGLAAEFLREKVPGSAVFAPCDVRGMVEAVHRLGTMPTIFDRTKFREDYSRRTIMREMARDILELAAAGSRA